MDALSEKTRSLLQQVPGLACHELKAVDTQSLAQTRVQCQHHETADSYNQIVARLSDSWRVVVCKDGIQWILQRTDAQRSGQARWKAVGYFQSSDTLQRVSRTACQDSDAFALAVIAALPKRIGGAA